MHPVLYVAWSKHHVYATNVNSRASTAYNAGDAVGVALQLGHLGWGGADVPHSHARLMAALEADTMAESLSISQILHQDHKISTTTDTMYSLKDVILFTHVL